MRACVRVCVRLRLRLRACVCARVRSCFVQAEQKFKLTQAEVEAFSPIDVELYRYFNQTLWVRSSTRCFFLVLCVLLFVCVLCVCVCACVRAAPMEASGKA